MTYGKLLKASVLKGMADGLSESAYNPLCLPEFEEAAKAYDLAYKFGKTYAQYVDTLYADEERVH